MAGAARLIVDVARLARDGERLQGELDPACLELDERQGGLVRPAGGLVYDLDVQIIGHELLVRGRIEQRIACTCRRCARVFEAVAGPENLTASLALTAEVDFVDLTPELRESMILTFPDHPVCQPGCRGLCPRCGADLNAGPCGCPPEPAAGLGGLDALGRL